jgi:hypothetical protein
VVGAHRITLRAVTKRGVPGWCADARLWVTIFIVGFWPAALLGRVFGVIVLLAVVAGGAYLANVAVRRSDADGSTARR